MRVILDEDGKPLTAGDTERRFFEASWIHKYNGKYYFPILQETLICSAMQQVITLMVRLLIRVVLTPVVEMWTPHHAIAEFKGKWYLFITIVCHRRRLGSVAESL